ncbi:MAG: hypothetical protein EP338_01130 [Bacteroidetes bacterium]|nr:MAG: hypothetical protein EP338_01130 [Bacteroidota bacterium]
MILESINWGKVAVGVLCITLGLLVLYIAYRKLLAYLGKGQLTKEKYAFLHRLEKSPASGQLEFYVELSEEKDLSFEILNEQEEQVKLVAEGHYESGSHIIYFDSTEVPNGEYIYQLKTDNQKLWKKMSVRN